MAELRKTPGSVLNLEQMKPFAPFSLAHTASKSYKEINSYLLSVASMREYFDKVLKKHT